MYAVSKCAPQEALRDLDDAYKHAFRRYQEGKRGKQVGWPAFKSRHKGVRQPMEREVGISPRRRHGHGERGGTQWSERTDQQSNTNQQYLFRNLWSSSTSSRISLGSCERCHWHSRRPASIRLSSGAAARAALIA
jgi:hypothetical protein